VEKSLWRHLEWEEVATVANHTAASGPLCLAALGVVASAVKVVLSGTATDNPDRSLAVSSLDIRQADEQAVYVPAFDVLTSIQGWVRAVGESPDLRARALSAALKVAMASGSLQLGVAYLRMLIAPTAGRDIESWLLEPLDEGHKEELHAAIRALHEHETIAHARFLLQCGVKAAGGSAVGPVDLVWDPAAGSASGLDYSNGDKNV
jgi:hypothetical protein